MTIDVDLLLLSHRYRSSRGCQRLHRPESFRGHARWVSPSRYERMRNCCPGAANNCVVDRAVAVPVNGKHKLIGRQIEPSVHRQVESRWDEWRHAGVGRQSRT